MGDGLSGQSVGIFGRLRDLFAWPIVICGISPDGKSAIPFSANTNGSPGGAVTEPKSTAFEASHILKASAGNLKELAVFNSKASAQFILLIDSATLPPDGAVTLMYPPIPIAAGQLLVLDLPVPVSAANGIVVCNSSTGTFTKTIGSADCAFYAQVI